MAWFLHNCPHNAHLCPQFRPPEPQNFEQWTRFLKSSHWNCTFQWVSSISDVFGFPLNCPYIAYICPLFWPPESLNCEKWVRFLKSSHCNCTFQYISSISEMGWFSAQLPPHCQSLPPVLTSGISKFWKMDSILDILILELYFTEVFINFWDVWFSRGIPLNCPGLAHLCPKFLPPESRNFEKWIRFLKSSHQNCTFHQLSSNLVEFHILVNF